MGMMDRDWYRERFARRVIGIQGPTDDPTGEPARIRRGVAKPRPQLPRGAEVGDFWRNVYLVACICAVLLWAWVKWRS